MSRLLDNLEQKIRFKAIEKSGDLFSNPSSKIPDSSVVEQASSAPTAEFAASLISEGEIVVDLTAGLGVNSFYFSRRAAEVKAIEINASRAQALAFNLGLSEATNICVINEDCIHWLESSKCDFDTVFVDPARRNSTGRNFMLKDATPDIFRILDILKRKKCICRVLLKASPLLDISSVLNYFQEIKSIYILESHREVKELLIEFTIGYDKENLPYVTKEVDISCVRLSTSGADIIKFKAEEYKTKAPLLKDVKLLSDGYLYEPCPALMKCGMFGGVASRFPGVVKLDPSTHIFYSSERIGHFPGRTFRITTPIGSRELKKIKGSRYNVISRNHPATASELEKRYNLKSSDSEFLIACRAAGHKIILPATLLR